MEGEGYKRTKLSAPEREMTKIYTFENEQQLTEYFAKEQKLFLISHLDFSGTEFQRKSMESLLDVPFGTTATMVSWQKY